MPRKIIIKRKKGSNKKYKVKKVRKPKNIRRVA